MQMSSKANLADRSLLKAVKLKTLECLHWRNNKDVFILKVHADLLDMHVISSTDHLVDWSFFFFFSSKSQSALASNYIPSHTCAARA